MNTIIYNSLITFFIIILYYYFSQNTYKYKYKETFVPKILKQTYRPIERNIRTKYEGFYNNTTTNVSNILRKVGIM